MWTLINSYRFIPGGFVYVTNLQKIINVRPYHGVPFLEFYKRTTGQTISEDHFQILKRRHPKLQNLSQDRIKCILQILEKFGITPVEACQHLHVFSMHPITMDNYGEIIKECRFINVLPQYIIRYHTLVRSRTIARLKKEGLINPDLDLEKVLLDQIEEWPNNEKSLQIFHDSNSSILQIRMSVLERYLKWKLSITTEEFQKYCRNYLPLKHKPMSDIQEALSIAENKLMFDNDAIRRNGFVISSDPLHTKLILDNVGTLAGLHIREAIRIEPAILKNNYISILQIRDILEEYRITEESQRRCLKVYCMRPETVRERLDELKSLKEYQILSTNPRMLSMVVHKKKMVNRLSKIQQAKKQCYSLNHLVSANKIFDNYINNFGDKVCGRDIAIMISTSLNTKDAWQNTNTEQTLLKQLRRHKFWLHAALNVIDANINFLKNKFDDKTITINCHLLLYPISEVQHYINLLLKMRNGEDSANSELHYNNLNCSVLTDNQILSLVLYEIEKKYHFSGDGIWTRQDGIKQAAS